MCSEYIVNIIRSELGTTSGPNRIPRVSYFPRGPDPPPLTAGPPAPPLFSPAASRRKGPTIFSPLLGDFNTKH